MTAIARRMEDHAGTPGLRYSQAIVNAGREAGASLEHPHGQLLGMPFVPREITDEQAGFARFAGNCLLCTTLDAEEAAGHRVVYADDDVVVVCPFWSGTPFEMLAIPRTTGPTSTRPTSRTSRPWAARCSGALSSLRTTARRRRLQRGVPLGALQGRGRLPLARAPAAEGHHPRRLRARHGRLINVVSPEEAAEALRESTKAA